ncbi:3-oxoadipate enol-lactonase [Pusillimonas sp. ANT_WB101]|uniref:3-oxoadipate enol-lactonase n=1 Tax=Pusillimonas sp. ANT_WB101 TaxID=2597356 RepID=UPI0011ED6763|nr:3-oxoadipate enol-lactonase [Pusillimonas sp. ANT_WB101]KAA0911578.1 3-oxoadipate enol-lactonase [Pusillimonas sp. ANT_WB101]
MTTAHFDSDYFHYTLDGKRDAPVVMFSNSLGTTESMWAAQTEALRQNFTVLTYDARGHGASIATKGPYTLEQLGNDVIKLLDHLSLSQVAFCGISMGGVTGQWLAIHASQRISQLIICNSAAKIGTPEAWQERADLVRSQGMAPVADGAAPRWFTEAFAASQPSTVSSLTDALRATNPEGYASCCEALAYADLREEIATITAPTLIIAGSHDPVTTTADADFMASRIAGSKRVDLLASHLSNIEASQAFNQAVLQFLV